MRLSTLSGVLIDGGIAGAGWATAEPTEASKAQVIADAKEPRTCFTMSSPRIRWGTKW
jgi:hypothetical protein